MKNFIYLVMFLGMVWPGKSQSRIEKNIPVEAGQKVRMNFTFPELITIKTWNKNEISIIGSISINQGENDDAFAIHSQAGEEISINSEIKNLKNLPRRISIKYLGEVYYFQTDDWNSPEIRKFKADKSEGNFQYMNRGVLKEITLEIMIPKNIELEVSAKYGLVEVIGFTKDMEIMSKHGGIDISFLPEVSTAMTVKTKFGEVYSNLDTEFKAFDPYEIGRWLTMEAKINSGRNFQRFETEFGNVYLRKR